MSVITLEEAVVDRLKGLRESTEVRDEAGNVVGTFYPESSAHQIPQHLLDKIDQAEIDRRCQSKERGRTTAEVLERLRALEKAS